MIRTKNIINVNRVNLVGIHQIIDPVDISFNSNNNNNNKNNNAYFLHIIDELKQKYKSKRTTEDITNPIICPFSDNSDNLLLRCRYKTTTSSIVNNNEKKF